jgi:hypothetical protein
MNGSSKPVVVRVRPKKTRVAAKARRPAKSRTRCRVVGRGSKSGGIAITAERSASPGPAYRKYKVSPMRIESDDLQFLAMFHYAIGAMAGMVALVPALHLFVATSLTPEGEPIDQILVRLFGETGAAVAAGLFLVLTLTLGGLLIAAGLGLARRRSYRFCRFASALGALFVPFGTLLAAVTLPLLDRPSTRELFTS